MTIELNTNLLQIFSGTYESMWEVFEYDDNGEELDINYTMPDLMRSIVEAYSDRSLDMVRDFDLSFIKSIVFPGGFSSPREYNFSTDTLDFTLEVDSEAMIAALDALDDSAEFAKYLRDNFSSRDGFWSWTPDNFAELRESIVNDGEHYSQSVGALLSYLIGEETLNDIEESVHDHWSSNGYMGLDYSIEDNAEIALA